MARVVFYSTVLLLLVVMARVLALLGLDLKEPDDDTINACREVKPEFEKIAEAYGSSDLAVIEWVIQRVIMRL